MGERMKELAFDFASILLDIPKDRIGAFLGKVISASDILHVDKILLLKRIHKDVITYYYNCELDHDDIGINDYIMGLYFQITKWIKEKYGLDDEGINGDIRENNKMSMDYIGYVDQLSEEDKVKFDKLSVDDKRIVYSLIYL